MSDAGSVEVSDLSKNNVDLSLYNKVKSFSTV